MKIGYWLSLAIFMVILAFIIISIIYTCPEATPLVKHFSEYSAILVAYLTLGYVVTTIFQFNSMQSQIVSMEKSIKLQSQPIPILGIRKVYLGKIKASKLNKNGAQEVCLKSEIIIETQFGNAGNGATLNLIIFPYLKLKKGLIPYPQGIPDFMPYIEKGKETNITKVVNSISFRINGKGIEIVQSFTNNEDIILAFDLYYENIFQVVFYEHVEYDLSINTSDPDDTRLKDKWSKFLNNPQSEMFNKLDDINSRTFLDANEFERTYKEFEKFLSDQFCNFINMRERLLISKFSILSDDYQNVINKAKDQYAKVSRQYFKK